MKARALLDIPEHGIKCGQFFTGPDKLVKALVKDGQADDKAQEAEVYGPGAIPPALEIAPAAVPEVDPEAAAKAQAEAAAKAAGK